MIKYQTKCEVINFWEKGEKYKVSADRWSDRHFNRAQLTELRDAIDQALNTSAEELDA